MIKVLVVDDSAFMRRELTRIMEEGDASIKVIETGRDGYDAIEKTKKLQPDVVTLDINMPRMDGLTALQHIMIECPRPCVMISSLTQEGAEETFEAMDIGAVDYIPKPSGAVSLNMNKQRDLIVEKIKGAVSARLPRRAARRVKVQKKISVLPQVKTIKTGSQPLSQKVVVIGVSTGGPKTLLDIIPKLPEDLKAAVLIAQHMPGGFTTTFANRLDSYSHISMKEADNSESIEDGKGYLAPGQFHMRVEKKGVTHSKGIIKLSDDPQDSLYRPMVDLLFESAADAYGSNSIGVILTGMGSDGVEGLEKIKKAGGITIAEDESTCIIYGMPKGAIERGIVDYILPSHRIADKIKSILNFRF